MGSEGRKRRFVYRDTKLRGMPGWHRTAQDGAGGDKGVFWAENVISSGKSEIFYKNPEFCKFPLDILDGRG